MNDSKIITTNDYTQFKFIEGNRDIKKSHVAFLKDSIEKNNLSHLRPIIVDENFFILDGQHRFLALKDLYLPIYYIQCTSDSYKELITLNRNQKNWNLTDFAKFYSTSFKNNNYTKLLELTQNYSISLQTLFIYLDFNYKTKKGREIFEEGNFLFDYDEEVVKDRLSSWKSLYDFLKEKNFDALDMISSLHFRKAFLYFINSRKINKQQFWERLNSNVVGLYRCFNFDQVLDMLLKLYNKQSPIKIEKGVLYL